MLPPSGAREKLVEPVEARKKEEKPAEPQYKPTRIVTSPVRGGQQIYAQGGDLVVMAPVSAGAELLADGNIHVYGPLRGRALAGVKGDTRARIFCQQMGARRSPWQGNTRPRKSCAAIPVGPIGTDQPVG